METRIKYFISYYWRDSFFKRGFGWVEMVHNKELKNGNDILEAEKLIQKFSGYKKAIILNFYILDRSANSDQAPFQVSNDWA